MGLLCAAAALGAAWFVLHNPGPPPGTADDPAAESRWMPRERSGRWTCIVIHHSAGTTGGADRFDQWHREKGWDELGYHFVIGNGTDTADGQVEVGPRWMSQKHGAHCRTPDEYYNQQGIGVCLVGNFDLAPPDDRQMRSLRRLVAFLCRAFGISPRSIYTHSEITGKTRCPGKYFDVGALGLPVNTQPSTTAAP